MQDNLNPLRSRFIFGDFIHPNMNKDAYRILTEKVGFLGLHRLIRNAVVLCWKEKTGKQNSAEGKGNRLLRLYFVVKKKEKSAKFT